MVRTMLGACHAGASRVIRLNGPTIGSKGQGLVSTVGKHPALNLGRSYGKKRDVVFRMNQVGGVGMRLNLPNCGC